MGGFTPSLFYDIIKLDENNLMSLKIEFYAEESHQGAFPEPVPASNCYPKWYSEISLSSKNKYKISGNDPRNLIISNSNNTVKKCLGIQDFLNTGYIIPSWTDFIFREQENGELFVNWLHDYWGETQYAFHNETEYKTMPNKPIYNHFSKIYTPWVVKTDPGVSCLITHPVWHRNKSFTTTTGILHTDSVAMRVAWFFEWNHKIQTQMDIEKLDNEKQVISKGDPLMLIIPFYRKEFSSKINYISKEKWNSFTAAQLNQCHDTIGWECPYKKFRKNLGKLFK